MSIGVGSVSHYGAKKPGPGVLPVRTGPLPSLTDQPFGKMPGIDWTTGKHLPLTKPVITENEAAAAKEKAIVPVVAPGSVIVLGGPTEGAETALQDSWRAGQNSGLEKWFVSRDIYNDAGDEILYSFMRKDTYDVDGRLFSTSAEVRVTVDVTVPET